MKPIPEKPVTVTPALVSLGRQQPAGCRFLKISASFLPIRRLPDAVVRLAETAGVLDVEALEILNNRCRRLHDRDGLDHGAERGQPEGRRERKFDRTDEASVR